MKKRCLISVALIVIMAPLAVAQEKTDAWLESLLRKKGSPLLQHILDHPDSFQYQLIYTQIDRDKMNQPVFKNHYLHVDRDRYFYPASTVKLPVALLALEKINELKVPGLDKYTPMLTDSAFSGQTVAWKDSTSKEGVPSVAHYVRKIFLVSDNDAYNRLYELMGQQRLNERLWEKGYTGIRVRHRFIPLSAEENRNTNPIRFVKNGKTIYKQPAATSTLSFDKDERIWLGNGYMDRNDNYIDTAMEFSAKNRFPLEDLQQILQSVIAPESVPAAKRFNLTPDDRKFVLKNMSEYPHESRFPAYDTAEFYDTYARFYLPGRSMVSYPAIRSFTKTGWSYGFLTDASYLVDFEHNTEYMLTATIYVNRNGILNDNNYDYEDVGRPFFKEVYNIIHEYETARKRKNKPDLGSLRFDYNKE